MLGLKAGVGPPAVPPAEPGTVLDQVPLMPGTKLGEAKYSAPLIGCELL